MTPAELTALLTKLEELEAKATAGEWKREGSILFAEDGEVMMLLAETGVGHEKQVEVIANQELILELRNNAKTLLALSRWAVEAKEALEKAEYYCADAKSIFNHFLSADMKKAIGYCHGSKCGLCPICRMNDGLNTMKLKRLSFPTLP